MVDVISIFDSLVRVEIRLWNDLESRLQHELGITLTFAQFLSFIARQGPCRVSDLADDLGITHSGTSRIVDRMEREGLAERASNPDDRRSSLIALTPRGVEVQIRADAVVRAALEERLAARLDPAQLGALEVGLAALRDSTADLRPAPAGDVTGRP